MGIREAAKALEFSGLNEIRSHKEPNKLKGMEWSEAIENTCVSPTQNKYVVSILDKPVTKQDIINNDYNLRLTRGLYFIKYVPLASKKSVNGFPYLISQDLIAFRAVFSGAHHFDACASRIPEFGWLKRNTTISNEMFAIAKKHPGMSIYFTLDIVKYCAKIEKIAEEKGLDIDHKPLVARICSEKDFEEVWKDLLVKGRPRKEINEFKRSYRSFSKRGNL